MITPEMAALNERVRAALPADGVGERRMFGTTCFMVDGAMAVASHGDGSLLVRVDPDDAAHLARPYVTRAEMGAGRSMGPGWIRVDAAGLTAEGDLVGWVETALRRDRTGARRPAR